MLLQHKGSRSAFQGSNCPPSNSGEYFRRLFPCKGRKIWFMKKATMARGTKMKVWHQRNAQMRLLLDLRKKGNGAAA